MFRPATCTAMLVAGLLAGACSTNAPAPTRESSRQEAARQPAAQPPQPVPEGDRHLALPHPGCNRSAAAHLEAGRALAARGERARAVEAFRQVLDHDPGAVDAVAALAYHAAEAGVPALGRRAAALWASLAPADPLPLLRGARLALEAEEDELALSLVEEALARDGSIAEGYHLAGRLHLRAERIPAALAAFTSAAELDPGHAHARNGLGLAHLHLGQWHEALEALSAATRLRPDVPFMHNNLGIAYERLGYHNEALAEYRMAVSLDPGYTKAQRNHRRLSAIADARFYGSRE